MSLNLEPKAVFDWFYKLNQIPRCSGNEKRVSDFLVNFAKERNLEVIQDELYNVIIKKPASKGYENSIPVIIQGHMDMVCVKSDDSNHNFDTDPIQMIVDGDYIKANNTTLGADNGIAVAYALAILDGNYAHPPLEILITTQEETGMDGASALKKGMLNGKRLINIDSEEEGVFLVSCAGGTNLKIDFDIEEEEFVGTGLDISISGLNGGHSGIEIVKQRANANKILARVLNEIRKHTDMRIVDISGGIKHNAIPSNAIAKILIKNTDNIEEIMNSIFNNIKKEYEIEDKNMLLDIKSSSYSKAFNKNLTDNYIDYFMLVPDGVVAMSKGIDGLVQTSLNNAIVLKENNILRITTSVRSSIESQIDMIIENIRILSKKVGAKLEQKSRYPAWQYEQNSKLRDISLSTYKQCFEKDATYTAIHAGLECGLLKNILPDCDMISYGPNIYDVHSPREKISISSTKNMWEFTIKLLENLK